MFKLFLSITLFFSGVTTGSQKTSMEQIIYLYDSQNKIKMVVNTGCLQCRDILEVKIIVLDELKEVLSNNIYTSTIEIKGLKNTSLNLPFLDDYKEMIYLRMEIRSILNNYSILSIDFPIYQNHDKECILRPNEKCVAKSPSIIKYEKGKIIEMKEEIVLANSNLMLYSPYNFLELNNVRIYYNLIDEKDIGKAYSTLQFKNKIDSWDMYFNKGYTFPLEIKKEGKYFYLDFEDNYYVSFKNGTTSENYAKDSFLMNKILLPFDEKRNIYELDILINDLALSFKSIKISFQMISEKELIGLCDRSKYCFRRGVI